MSRRTFGASTAQPGASHSSVGEDERPYLKTVVNVSQVPQRSPFRYPGGKTWLVPHVRRWLSSLPFRPNAFVEPFAGGAIVGLTVAFERYAEKVILVERDDDVAAVWKAILNGHGRKLVQRIATFELSFESVQKILAAQPSSLVDQAFAALVRNRVQHGGIMAPGASLMKDGENKKGLASRWYPQTLCERIVNIMTVKRSIDFLHGDGLEVMASQMRRRNTVLFIDPPYTISGRRLYKHSDLDHERLFWLASRGTADFLMTYDASEEIKNLSTKYNFDLEEVAMMGRLNTAKIELLIGRDLSWAKEVSQTRELPFPELSVQTRRG